MTDARVLWWRFVADRTRRVYRLLATAGEAREFLGHLNAGRSKNLYRAERMDAAPNHHTEEGQ